MERINPYIDKLVGISPDQKDLEQKWHAYIIDHIETIGGERIEDFEVDKTQREIILINFVITAVDKMLNQYGRRKQIDIPPNNIHILKENGTALFSKDRLSNGAHSSLQQSIIIDREPSEIQFCVELFHELLHAKCYNAIQLIYENKDDDNSARTASYRKGISVVSRDGKTVRLRTIEEAVIGYLTELFYNSLATEPLFEDEITKVNTDAPTILLSRQEELLELNTVVDMIYERNKQVFPDRSAVLNLFIDAQVNGQVLPIARIVEKTFGTGAMKAIDPQVIT